jgi:hypothetical protein
MYIDITGLPYGWLNWLSSLASKLEKPLVTREQIIKIELPDEIRDKIEPFIKSPQLLSQWTMIFVQS